MHYVTAVIRHWSNFVTFGNKVLEITPQDFQKRERLVKKRRGGIGIKARSGETSGKHVDTRRPSTCERGWAELNTLFKPGIETFLRQWFASSRYRICVLSDPAEPGSSFVFTLFVLAVGTKKQSCLLGSFFFFSTQYLLVSSSKDPNSAVLVTTFGLLYRRGLRRVLKLQSLPPTASHAVLPSLGAGQSVPPRVRFWLWYRLSYLVKGEWDDVMLWAIIHLSKRW